MGQRILQILIAECLAFGSFVLGGIALLGAFVTATGDSKHPAAISWILVGVFGTLALVLGRAAIARLRAVFRSRREAGQGAGQPSAAT